MKKKFIASFDVDPEKTFTHLTGELPVDDGENIVDDLNKQAKLAEYRVGSMDAHPPNAKYFTEDPSKVLTPVISEKPEPNMDVYWPKHGVPGTKGFELLDGLPDVSEYDFFVFKGLMPDMHPYGACYHDMAGKMSTGVIEWLKNREVQCVIVGGLATDYCVATTAIQLKEADFKVIVNLEATRGVAKDSTKKAISEMIDKGVILAVGTQEVEELLQSME